MALTKAFYEVVSAGNIKRVRIMMKDSLLVDPSFSEFEEMVNATRNLQGMYDSHDGRELNYDKSTWADSYMNELMVQIVGNFSHERINHLKEVVAYLRPVPSHPKGGNGGGQHSESDLGVKIVGGMVAGAVIGGTVAAVTSATVAGGVAVGAVIGGVAVVVITKGEH